MHPRRPPKPEPDPNLPDRPGPGGEGGGEGPTLPGPSETEKRIRELESRVAVIEDLFKKLNQVWPQIEQKLLQSEDPKVQELAAQLGKLRQELASSVQQAREEAKKAAKEENATMKAKLAELAGQVITLQQIMGLVRDYVAAREQGLSPKGALAETIDTKLQALESRLTDKLEKTSSSDIAAALTYVGVPSFAAVLISFFLAGALKKRAISGIEELFEKLRKRDEK